MVGHGGSSAGSYLADPTSPIPSHCASVVVTSTVRVNSCCKAVTMMKIHLFVGHSLDSIKIAGYTSWSLSLSLSLSLSPYYNIPTRCTLPQKSQILTRVPTKCTRWSYFPHLLWKHSSICREQPQCHGVIRAVSVLKCVTGQLFRQCQLTCTGAIVFHSFCCYSVRQHNVTDGQVVRAGVSVTWNVLSWSGGHEFKLW